MCSSSCRRCNRADGKHPIRGARSCERPAAPRASLILTLTRSGTHPCAHVLDVARRHLRTLDERIAQLTKFRDRLVNEVSKWDGIEQPTCEGLCRIITEADEEATTSQLPRRDAFWR